MTMMPIESNPSISLPLLIGLSRSTGSTTTTNNNNNKAAATQNEKQPSNLTPQQPSNTTNNNNTKQQLNFPQKLHALLSNNNTQHVISWMVHGRSFKVHNVTCFVTQLLSEHFNNTNSTSSVVASGDVAASSSANSNTNTNNNNNQDVEITDYEQFETILKSWGFQQILSSTTSNNSNRDVGSWYHEKFLRGHYDLVTEIEQRSVVDNNKEVGDKSKGAKKGKSIVKKSSKLSKEEAADIVATAKALNEAPSQQPPPPPPPPVQVQPIQHSMEVQNFLSFTSTTDHRVATQYLEMAANNLEMAVSLFMDHGQPSGAALGLAPLPVAQPPPPVNAEPVAQEPPSAASNSSKAASQGGGDYEEAQSDSDPEEEEEEEPDFYSLPFMPPLPPTQPSKPRVHVTTPAETQLEIALREYNAFSIIRRTILYWLERRRIKKLGFVTAGKMLLKGVAVKGSGAKGNNNSTPTAATLGTSHYLFKSLTHSSLPVRRSAARIIMTNLHYIEQRNTKKRAWEDDSVAKINSGGGVSGVNSYGGVRNEGLQQVLITLLHTLMFGQVPYQQQQQSLLSTNNVNQRGMMIPRTKNQAQGGDPALQIMGMLISLITDGGFTNILVGNEVKELLMSNPTLSIGLPPPPSIGLGGSSVGGDSNDILCKKLLQELSSDSIESFVAAGGLRWACGSIVRLVHLLIHGPNGGSSQGDGNMGSGSATNTFMQHGHNSDSDGNNSTHNSSNVDQSMEDITARTIQTRLMLLIDLVYRLVLYGSVPAAVDNSSLSVTSLGGSGDGDDNNGGDGGDKKSSSSKKDVTSRSAKKKLIKSAIQSREQELLELLARTEGSSSSSGNNPYSRAGGGGETSRTSSLRQSLRAPPLAGTSRTERKRALSSSSRLSGGGGSLANLPSSGGGGGGGDNGPSSAVLDENRRRKDRRRATLERVHKLFWSSTLPAAVCVPPSSTDTSTVNDESSTMAFGELTPLACLISAYEILRSRPTSHPTLSTNTSLRTFNKGIAILGRIIDAGANNPVVVVDGELPWGLASILSDDNKKTTLFDSHGAKESKKRKRGRSSSHDGHHHRSSRSSSTVRSARRGSASAASSGDNSPARRAKRSRASGNVASLLERLQGDAAAASSRSGGGGSSSRTAAASALDSAVVAASLRAAGSSSASRSASASADFNPYRSAMESMLRASPGRGSSPPRGSSPSGGGGGGAVSASALREASLSRLLASGSTAAPSPGLLSANRRRTAAAEDFLDPEDMMDVDLDEMEIINESETREDEDDEGGNDTNNDDTNNDDDDENSDDDDEDSEIENDDEIVNVHDLNDDDNQDGDEDAEDLVEVDAEQFEDAVINLDDLETSVSQGQSSQKNPHRHSTSARSPASRFSSGGSSMELALKKRERESTFLRASMSILAVQYPELLSGLASRTVIQGSSSGSCNRFSIFASPAAHVTPPLLTNSAEQSLLKSLCNIIKPPRKPLNLKLFLRRTPTQEEFFRGNLSKNPIGLASLKPAGASSGGGSNNRSNEPLVSDLRLHIAKDLQMEDSAEMLELLVANKILDMNLKLRVVQQVVWKKYVEENATSAAASGVAGAGANHQMISTGSGMSMIFSSSALLRGRTAGNSVADDNAILQSFPPMVVTYRLAGVDGEATEDNLTPDDIDDPEAPSAANSTPAAIERRMEKEFGITRMITQNRGVAVLLASVQGTISDLLRRIRRDEVARRRMLRNVTTAGEDDNNEDGNTTREQLAKSPPCPGLTLLRLCANISDNRKKLLANRAPTLLLRILLDILNAMNRSSDDGNRKGRKRSSTIDFSSQSSMEVDNPSEGGDGPVVPSSTRNKVHHVEGNPTTEALQEIIEMLASDISTEISDEKASPRKSLKKSSSSRGSLMNLTEGNEAAVGQQEEDRTLPLVLKSLHSTELSPPLRKVIAKLLPFLTYGQVSQSRELASYFKRYVNVNNQLGSMEGDDSQQGNVLMKTFVDTAINLPPVSVCDNLRQELISNGFVESVRSFLMKDAPSQPPPWSPALYSKSCKKLSEKKSSELREEWRTYFDRPGIAAAFKILTGLCSGHNATQLLLVGINDHEDQAGEDMMKEESSQDGLNLLTLCHWIESTSDNTASGITNPDGILAETFLDALKDDNELSAEKINAIRKQLRDRKRELAEERRNKALSGMRLSAGSTSSSATAAGQGQESASSMFGGLFNAFSSSSAAASSTSQTRTTRAAKAKETAAAKPKEVPAWMAEMEAMDDEAGVTCAVCQEGRTLQPSELLGLYAYLKKVTIPSNQGGNKGDIDGCMMLLSLPTSLPSSLTGNADMKALFTKARSATNALEGSSHALNAMSASSSSSSSGNSRSNYYITTVSAGNAIHCSCHKRAKTADRNHPKAPKSEWEGASLRNSRVTCNVILPLVSSKASTVSLLNVETALAEYNAIATNTLGVRQKSNLWGCLHDMRFLLLRMAYGESLSVDCGGGSSSSNFLLLLYQLYSADMFAQNAEHDESIEVSRHARNLSAGFIVAEDIVDDVSFDRIGTRSKKLEKGVADAAPMSALLSILFYNMDDTKSASGSAKKTNDQSKQTPSPTRQWETYKDTFLAGLVRCAGRRHSLGLTDSGCVTSRGISTGRNKNVEKARSYLEWSEDDEAAMNRTTMIEEYGKALRPMITLYAVFDQLSKEFVVNNDDESTEESSERLAAKLESCYKAATIQELLQIADINVGHNVISKLFEKGCSTAY